MHDLLFDRVSEWSGNADAVDKFKGYAAELGLETKAFADCLDLGETQPQMQAQLEEALSRGVSSVPIFFANDWIIEGAQAFQVFQQTIERALLGEHPPPTPTPLPPGKSIFDVNPERPGYTYGGDASRGSAEAPVLLVEFVDLASADNRTHALEAWPALQTKYLDSGKVRLVVKHLPAADSAPALQAAEAVECAGAQGAFWEMYELLFQNQSEWSAASDVPGTIKGYAARLGLGAAAFANCVDTGETKAKVLEDLSIGQQNSFPAAPVFFIFMGQQGGYAPLDQLEQAIEQFVGQ